MNLEMISDREGKTEAGRLVPAGTKVTYMAHTSGGNVRVRLSDDSEEIMNPNCFPHLRGQPGRAVS